jgi:hypothetical protein
VKLAVDLAQSQFSQNLAARLASVDTIPHDVPTTEQETE